MTLSSDSDQELGLSSRTGTSRPSLEEQIVPISKLRKLSCPEDALNDGGSQAADGTKAHSDRASACATQGSAQATGHKRKEPMVARKGP